MSEELIAQHIDRKLQGEKERDALSDVATHINSTLTTPATSFGATASVFPTPVGEDEEDFEFDVYDSQETVPHPEDFALQVVVPRPELCAGTAGKKSGRMEAMLERLDSGDVSACEFQGWVRYLAFNRIGSRVLQRVFSKMQPGDAGVLADEFIGVVSEAARHRYASRALAALLQSQSGELDPTTVSVVDELLCEAPELARDVFGSQLLLTLLEHGTPKLHDRVVLALSDDEGLMLCSMDEFGSFVVDKALAVCQARMVEFMVQELMREHLSMLATDAPGCRVLRSLLRTSSHDEVTQITVEKRAAVG